MPDIKTNTPAMEKRDVEALGGSKASLRWLKQILFTFWTCRMALLVLMGIAEIASIYWISQETDIKGMILASLVVTVLFAVLCIALDAVSMILLGRAALTPLAFLVFQVTEVVLWSVVVAVEIITALQASSKRSFLTWFISAVLYVSIISLSIYAGILLYRSRSSQKKLGTYRIAEQENSSESSLHRPSLSPVNPFDNAYAALQHSRNVSTASAESMHGVLPPPPYEPSRSSTPQSSSSFVIITPPEHVADISGATSHSDLHRFA